MIKKKWVASRVRSIETNKTDEPTYAVMLCEMTDKMDDLEITWPNLSRDLGAMTATSILTFVQATRDVEGSFFLVD